MNEKEAYTKEEVAEMLKAYGLYRQEVGAFFEKRKGSKSMLSGYAKNYLNNLKIYIEKVPKTLRDLVEPAIVTEQYKTQVEKSL
jgi:hypothetical protein